MTTKIAIIGIDGSGKTTLINKLEKRLILNGYAVKKLYGFIIPEKPWIAKCTRIAGDVAHILLFACIFTT